MLQAYHWQPLGAIWAAIDCTGLGNGFSLRNKACCAVVKKEYDRLLPYAIPGLPGTTT